MMRKGRGHFGTEMFDGNRETTGNSVLEKPAARPGEAEAKPSFVLDGGKKA